MVALLFFFHLPRLKPLPPARDVRRLEKVLALILPEDKERKGVGNDKEFARKHRTSAFTRRVERRDDLWRCGTADIDFLYPSIPVRQVSKTAAHGHAAGLTLELRAEAFDRAWPQTVYFRSFVQDLKGKAGGQ